MTLMTLRINVECYRRRMSRWQTRQRPFLPLKVATDAQPSMLLKRHVHNAGDTPS